MSRFTTFGSVILLFILMSLLVVFGFFIFTPKIKTYRALNIELQQSNSDYAAAKQVFDKQYKALQNLQDREKNIDIALQKHFDLEQFKNYLQTYLPSPSLVNINTTTDANYQIALIDVRTTINSPVVYYRFIEALNAFKWVVEINGNQQFKGTEEGIETHFTLKVWTAR